MKFIHMVFMGLQKIFGTTDFHTEVFFLYYKVWMMRLRFVVILLPNFQLTARYSIPLQNQNASYFL